MIEALCRPGRDPREDLPPPIFRKDVVKFEDLQAGMELRGTVLNVVDFGAFVDVGLSDSGLIHISQLSAGYVRDPHDVVAVGDQVRAWVSSIDKDRRRVALTMIEPGTERPKPAKPAAQARPAPRRTARCDPAAVWTSASPRRRTRRYSEKAACGRRRDKPRRGDRRGPPQRQPRSGAYEKRAAKKLVPITEAMAEGKEYCAPSATCCNFTKRRKSTTIPLARPNNQPAPPADGSPAVE